MSTKLEQFMEYRVTFQRAAESNDPVGTTTMEGDNFPNLVALAERQGYPRVIAGEQRVISPWRPIEPDQYQFDEATP